MLTPESIDALPVGSRFYDRDGDELTRVEKGWVYTQTLSSVNCYMPGMATKVLLWPPYSLVPPIDPADPGYDHSKHANR